MALQAQLSNILICDAKSIKDLGFIAEELDEVIIPSSIRFIQDSRIQFALGTKLYEAILTAISTDNIPERFSILLDSYIVNAIGYFVNAELQIPLSKKLRNKGNIETGDERVLNSAIKDIQYVAEHFNNRGEFYLSTMIRYIRQNITIYPEFGLGDAMDVKSDTAVYKSPIYLGNGYTTCNKRPENP